MLTARPSLHTTEQTNTTQTPAESYSWRFGDLLAAELLPKLQQHLITQDPKANWQVIWLQNDGRPVIGLLPKTAWRVYVHDTNEQAVRYQVIRTNRDDLHKRHQLTTDIMSYSSWQEALIAYSRSYDQDDSRPSALKTEDNNDSQPSYHHGLMGFIGYDMAAHELSPAAKIEYAAQPCAVLGHYDIYLTPSNKTMGWTLNTIDPNPDSEASLAALVSYLETLDNDLSNPKNKADAQPAPLLLKARWHQSDYQQAFAQTQRYLQQGDCYQINLTQAWQGRLNNKSSCNDHALIDHLPALHQSTQAPFAGYLGVNHAQGSSLSFELLSCSPELFFTFLKKGSNVHHIRTKPIKGTRPRGSDPEQDFALRQQLIDSDKDQAENVMIVDLLRNDLGKYAKTGSVKVPQLFAIESFSNVHHMVSTITAELKSEAHPLTVLFGSLPAGSITGTPKKRAVEIISELEAGARGAYCGTMGYMNFDGSGQWNVLIRSLQANHSADDDNQVRLWAGGGITVASDCEDEYQECLDKVGNLLAVLKQE
ncbi:anthranilate synthase component I family protein [Psychrobacter sp. F1192]|uniref:Anthranilate synthase component I family protein n=1 Tax=Psychrobacter coccoides TaxID=2818440 RepID=A0ABS3NPG5_9GAMM|nr:anthranilate synthase component I family protein [Psychrobacter coccoides]MBO1531295.1 anthranilate synthase component I family protein [Psychrobacter coccoides]